MKYNDIATKKAEVRQLDESTKVYSTKPGEHFFGLEPGTPEHDKMIETMAWTKTADPELYKKIMSLD